MQYRACKNAPVDQESQALTRTGTLEVVLYEGLQHLLGEPHDGRLVGGEVEGEGLIVAHIVAVLLPCFLRPETVWEWQGFEYFITLVLFAREYSPQVEYEIPPRVEGRDIIRGSRCHRVAPRVKRGGEDERGAATGVSARDTLM